MPNWRVLLEDRIKAPIGEEFYVGGAGASDAKSGQIAEEPLLKIATALEQCKSGRHDVIWVQDYWANDTFPIVLNKQCVHILGLSTKALSSQWPIMNAGDNPCFQIGGAGGDYCEIAGLSMITNATNPCIEVVGTNCRIHLHHLALGEHGVARDGILVPTVVGQDLNWSTVEHCIFGQFLVRDGIKAFAASWTDIRNNIFVKYGGIGVNITGPVDVKLGQIIRNRFYKGQAAIGAAAGWAITIEDASEGMIDDNRAMESGVAPQNNPYKDASTGVPGTTKNGWGANWSGAVTVMPDVS